MEITGANEETREWRGISLRSFNQSMARCQLSLVVSYFVVFAIYMQQPNSCADVYWFDEKRIFESNILVLISYKTFDYVDHF